MDVVFKALEKEIPLNLSRSIAQIVEGEISAIKYFIPSNNSNKALTQYNMNELYKRSKTIMKKRRFDTYSDKFLEKLFKFVQSENFKDLESVVDLFEECQLDSDLATIVFSFDGLSNFKPQSILPLFPCISSQIESSDLTLIHTLIQLSLKIYSSSTFPRLLSITTNSFSNAHLSNLVDQFHSDTDPKNSGFTYVLDLMKALEGDVKSFAKF